jgi:hypothetical protein
MPIHFANYIYPFTIRDSPHRQLAIDICIHGWGVNAFPNLRDYTIGIDYPLPQELLLDVVSQMGMIVLRKKETKALVDILPNRDPCKYHEHGGNDGVCYKEQRRDLFGVLQAT